MSELTNNYDRVANFRWQQLVTTSTIALLGYFQGFVSANAADDTSKPSVWIELGGQLNRLGNAEKTFDPAIFDARPSIFDPSQSFERPARYSFDETGSIVLQPQHSSWEISASVRYGRSNSTRHARQQTTPQPFYKYNPSYPSSHPARWPVARKFADTSEHNNESHLIVDFQAGKDVGLGMFGTSNGQSVVSLGVRFAQFSNRSNVSLKSDPDWHFSYKYFYGIKATKGQVYHSNMASLNATRSFHGIGPSISWKAEAPIIGSDNDGEVSLDWGLNAAILFGRQRADVHHQSTVQYKPTGRYTLRYQVNQTSKGIERSRSVTVPNVGAVAGASYRIDNFKISAGYRADFFFGAMDGGVDARKTYDRSFYGPYATISIGLGG